MHSVRMYLHCKARLWSPCRKLSSSMPPAIDPPRGQRIEKPSTEHRLHLMEREREDDDALIGRLNRSKSWPVAAAISAATICEPSLREQSVMSPSSTSFSRTSKRRRAREHDEHPRSQLQHQEQVQIPTVQVPPSCLSMRPQTPRSTSRPMI